jgi:hypothetical protein
VPIVKDEDHNISNNVGKTGVREYSNELVQRTLHGYEDEKRVVKPNEAMLSLMGDGCGERTCCIGVAIESGIWSRKTLGLK